ncbi:MAG: acetyl-CoA carboxylase carboxyltransferase subunit beta [Candidatus Brocadiae bacterium]|nr:acetyl-CoA carboxylase carboxyltransferase subunit beta [Candidatus Brocadiia bacterium]
MAFDGLRRFISRRKKLMPDGLWMRCDDCSATIYKRVVEERYNVCPECNYHFSMTALQRLAILVDDETFVPMWTNLVSGDPLQFRAESAYADKVREDQARTGLKDAVVAGTGDIYGKPSVLVVTDSRFIMGSMGSVVGETIARAAEYARDHRLPLIVVSGSGGGARMYEGALSLMQMAKTSAAIARLHEAGGLFISVLTNPTMAGVMASFASLGDVIIAEPKALIGFTGPRVIKQTIKQELPEGFQRSEFLLEHGFIDQIVPRPDLKDRLSQLIEAFTPAPAANRH